MSDYVTNLARRSVGLAPLSAPRIPAAPLVSGPMPESPTATPAAAPARGVEALPAEPDARAPVPQVTLVPVDHAQPPGLPPAASLELPPRRTEVLTRIEVAAREPARLETTVIVPAKAEPVSGANPALEPAPLRASPTLAAPEPAPLVGNLPEPDLPAPIVLPARAEPPPAREPAPREVVPFETVRELTHRFEKIIEPAPVAAPSPTALPLAPTAVPAAPRMPEVPAPESRVVQVRIGSIEIHGAAPAAPAPAPVAASAAAARVAAGGFDQFTRLRSYAQWEW